MEKKYAHSRIFKTKKQCETLVKSYGLTDYKIKNTSFNRQYQGRLAHTRQYIIYYN